MFCLNIIKKSEFEILESLTIEDLKDILVSNPELVEKFILDTVNLETLEKLLQKLVEGVQNYMYALYCF